MSVLGAFWSMRNGCALVCSSRSHADTGGGATRDEISVSMHWTSCRCMSSYHEESASKQSAIAAPAMANTSTAHGHDLAPSSGVRRS